MSSQNNINGSQSPYFFGGLPQNESFQPLGSPLAGRTVTASPLPSNYFSEIPSSIRPVTPVQPDLQTSELAFSHLINQGLQTKIAELNEAIELVRNRIGAQISESSSQELVTPQVYAVHYSTGAPFGQTRETLEKQIAELEQELNWLTDQEALYFAPGYTVSDLPETPAPGPSAPPAVDFSNGVNSGLSESPFEHLFTQRESLQGKLDDLISDSPFVQSRGSTPWLMENTSQPNIPTQPAAARKGTTNKEAKSSTPRKKTPKQQEADLKVRLRNKQMYDARKAELSTKKAEVEKSITASFHKTNSHAREIWKGICKTFDRLMKSPTVENREYNQLLARMDAFSPEMEKTPRRASSSSNAKPAEDSKKRTGAPTSAAEPSQPPKKQKTNPKPPTK